MGITIRETGLTGWGYAALARLRGEERTLEGALRARGYTPGHAEISETATRVYSMERVPGGYGESLGAERMERCELLGRTYWASQGPSECPAWAKGRAK
jgi:hypothetical protein